MGSSGAGIGATKGDFGVSGSALDVTESIARVTMTHTTLVNVTDRFIKARDRSDPGLAVPWFGLLFSCIAAMVGNATVITFGKSELDLKAAYGAVAIFSFGKMLAIVWRSLLAFLYNRDRTHGLAATKSRRWPWLRVNCPPDWVPTNVTAYVQVALQEMRVQADQEKTLRESESPITPIAPSTPST